jgi:hypothetical protein
MVATALYALALLGTPPHSQTTPFEFFGMYVAQLATFEQLRAGAEEEVKESAGDPVKTSIGCIHSGTRFDLELGSAASMLDGMHLVGHFGDQQLEPLPHQIADIYRLRRALLGKITAICTAFAEAPKPGIDYKALAAQMPKLRASLEDLDSTLFEGGTLAFMTLVSDKEDAQGRTNQLVISCTQKQELLTQLKDEFGEKLEQKGVPPGVEQAQLFRDKLIEYKCAEEPR